MWLSNCLHYRVRLIFKLGRRRRKLTFAGAFVTYLESSFHLIHSTPKVQRKNLKTIQRTSRYHTLFSLDYISIKSIACSFFSELNFWIELVVESWNWCFFQKNVYSIYTRNSSMFESLSRCLNQCHRWHLWYQSTDEVDIMYYVLPSTKMVRTSRYSDGSNIELFLVPIMIFDHFSNQSEIFLRRCQWEDRYGKNAPHYCFNFLIVSGPFKPAFHHRHFVGQKFARITKKWSVRSFGYLLRKRNDAIKEPGSRNRMYPDLSSLQRILAWTSVVCLSLAKCKFVQVWATLYRLSTDSSRHCNEFVDGPVPVCIFGNLVLRTVVAHDCSSCPSRHIPRYSTVINFLDIYACVKRNVRYCLG